MQKLRLRWGITDEDREERSGAPVASRLKGPLLTQTMSFAIIRGGATCREDEAMALPAVAAEKRQCVVEKRSGMRQTMEELKATAGCATRIERASLLTRISTAAEAMLSSRPGSRSRRWRSMTHAKKEGCR